MRIDRLSELEAFVTKDGSSIRELAGTAIGTAANQSLAEATVPAGGETEEHFHRLTEEVYYFVSGSGRMRLGEEERDVAAGDCVVIEPGAGEALLPRLREAVPRLRAVADDGEAAGRAACQKHLPLRIAELLRLVDRTGRQGSGRPTRQHR